MTMQGEWVLTDTRSRVHVPSIRIDSTQVPGSPAGWWVARETLRGGQQDGVDLVEICNGPMTIAILPTRGMGIWKGRYREVDLGWRSPVAGPVHPKFVHLTDRKGIGWLAGFDEWLCRCGLVSNGPPGDDRGAALTLHGRIANLPAESLRVSVDPRPPYAIRVIGEVVEGGMFLGQLRLRTTYELIPGSNRLTIRDEVVNAAGQTAEMQLLYHLNNGPPLLEAGSRVAIPFREMAPHTAHAMAGLDTFDRCAGPVANFAEEVFDFLPAADSAGATVALLQNAAGSLGLALRWKVAELPCFTVWKNTAALTDGYVVGLEPATNFPYFKAHERDQGRVRTLPPGGTWTATWSIEILDTPTAVDSTAHEIATLQATVKPTVRPTPVFGPPS